MASSKTSCKAGHLFDTANTILRKNGSKSCRTCKNERKVKDRADNLLYTATPKTETTGCPMMRQIQENIKKNGLHTILPKALANIASGIPAPTPEEPKEKPKSWALVDTEFDNMKASDLEYDTININEEE